MMSGPEDRGQTLHDFAIGIVIFLLVLGYVFGFIPGLFEPFSPDSRSTSVRVDRTADFLTADLLATEETAYALNESCTRVFFNISPPSNCHRISETVDEDHARTLAGLPANVHLNVTMAHTGGPAVDPETGELLALGPPSESARGQVIRAVRVVTFDGLDYRFIVKLW